MKCRHATAAGIVFRDRYPLIGSLFPFSRSLAPHVKPSVGLSGALRRRAAYFKNRKQREDDANEQ